MTSTEEKRAIKALESIGWALKRLAFVLESSTKGSPRSDTPCARCGSFLLQARVTGAEQHAACAVCELKAGVARPEPAADVPPEGPHS